MELVLLVLDLMARAQISPWPATPLADGSPNACGCACSAPWPGWWPPGAQGC